MNTDYELNVTIRLLPSGIQSCVEVRDPHSYAYRRGYALTSWGARRMAKRFAKEIRAGADDGADNTIRYTL